MPPMFLSKSCSMATGLDPKHIILRKEGIYRQQWQSNALRLTSVDQSNVRAVSCFWKNIVITQSPVIDYVHAETHKSTTIPTLQARKLVVCIFCAWIAKSCDA